MKKIKDKKKDEMRPKFAKLIAQLEQDSFTVGKTNSDLKLAIEQAKKVTFNERVKSQKQNLLNAAKIKLMVAQKAYQTQVAIQKKNIEYKAMLRQVEEAKTKLEEEELEKLYDKVCKRYKDMLTITQMT